MKRRIVVKQTCAACGGLGWKWSDYRGQSDCEACNGNGEVAR